MTRPDFEWLRRAAVVSGAVLAIAAVAAVLAVLAIHGVRP